jgi:heme A synthase
MTVLRRLSYTALLLAFAQVVFGAVVRITGSGMGCGDHWPKCLGQWVPPLNRPDLVIEWTHRFLALALGIAVVALFVAAFRHRNDAELDVPAADGARAVFRAATLASVLYLAAAIFGAITVKLDLHALSVVIHLTIAMALLATIAAAVLRSGGLGARVAAHGGGSGQTARATRAAAVIVFVILVLGALTANLPGAAASCQGFPLCRNGYAGNVHVQLTHRVLAFLLFFHLVGVTLGTARRKEPRVVVGAVRVALAVVVGQIIVAAALVELFLPPSLQALHQGVGTLVWLATFTAAALASRAARGVPRQAGVIAPAIAPTPVEARPHTVAVIIARGADL